MNTNTPQTPREVPAGTHVIHARFDTVYVYDGPAPDGYELQIAANLRAGYVGLMCDASQVAPVSAVTVPSSSPRVVAVKGPSPLSYGPRTVWKSTLDGVPVARAAKTRREAAGEALRALAILQWHQTPETIVPGRGELVAAAS